MVEPIESPTPPWLAEEMPTADRRGVTRRMAALIGEWEASGDRRAIFLSCYAMMTRNMLAAIDAGEFLDPPWVHDLLDRFADYYFRALEMADAGEPATPAVWRLAFDAASTSHGHVLQNLLLGINAHINYDLVLCLADLLSTEWGEISPAARQIRYEDHCHVNSIIAGTIEAVQDQIVERYAPLMAVVDVALGPIDEWLVRRLIVHWRDEVWEHVTQRMALPDDTAREADRIRIEEDGVALGHLIRLQKIVASLEELT